MAVNPIEGVLKGRTEQLLSKTITDEIPHNEGGGLATEFFVSCSCKFRRLTGGNSWNLQDAAGRKGIIRRVAVLRSISILLLYYIKAIVSIK